MIGRGGGGGGGGGGGRDRFHLEYSPRFEEKGHFGRNCPQRSRHLWVGNLSPHITQSALSEHFLRFGELDRIAFLPGRSYAFVNYRREEDADIAMRTLQGFLLAGLPMKIDFVKGERSSPSLRGEENLRNREERRAAGHRESFYQRDSRMHHSNSESFYHDKFKGDNKSAEPSEVLWIGFPSFLDVDEMVLRRAFSPFGEIEKITAFPGRSYAFVQYKSVVAACRAKDALQGKLFNNPRVNICFAKSELGSAEHGRDSVDDPFPPHITSKGHPVLGERHAENFQQDRNFGSSSGELHMESPRFVSNLEMSRDSGIIGFGRNNSMRTGASGTFDKTRLQGLGSELGLSEDTYEYHSSPAADRGVLRRGFLPERSRRSPFFEDSREFREDAFLFREAKKLKTASFPDKELPEYPFSESEQEKQHTGLPKLFPDFPECETHDKSFESGPFGYKRLPDRSKNLIRPHAERDYPWKSHGGFEAGSGPLPIKPVNWQKFTPESHLSPPNEEWKWEGTIAKGGTPVCRARCFPVGKVLDVTLPEFLNCTARTGLDMLAKHFYQAASVWVVFFVAESDADIVFYNEFMHYLGEKQRAAVAKLGEKTTLFLVPPSDFSEKVLKVPGKVSISGVILRFQQPSSNFSSLHRPLEATDLKLPSLMHRAADGINFQEDSSYMRSTSPDPIRSSARGQSYFGSSLEPFSSATPAVPALSKSGIENLSYTGNMSESASTSSYSGSILAMEKVSDSLKESRYDQHQHQNMTLPSNWSPYHMRSSNSTTGNFSSEPSNSHSFDDSMVQEYLAVKPRVVQGTSSGHYIPGSSGIPLSGSKIAHQEIKQLSSSTPVPPLQPEQLAQLASLLGQQQQSGKVPVLSQQPNQLEQTFKSDQKSSSPNYASASSDPSESHFSQMQQVQQHALNGSLPQTSRTDVQTGSPELQGNQQLQNGSREETEADPQKRLQATLQLAAALLQQIQQQAKAVDQR